MSEPRGMDASRWQGLIDWPLIPDRMQFCPIGVRDFRTGQVDPMADRNVSGCFLRGVIPGGYQRVNPLRNSPEREAAMFIGTLSELDLLGRGRLVPALDVEPVESGRDLEAEHGIDMRAWVRELFAAWLDLSGGARVLWYSSGSFFATRYGGLVGIPEQVDLWIAHWSGQFSVPKNLTDDPDLAEQWAGRTQYTGDANHRMLIHQYWSKGTVPGIGPDPATGQPVNVDLNCLAPGVRLTEVMQ